MDVTVFKEETGTTLIETVVALSILLGVLIPLGVIVGNLMVEETAADIRQAVHCATSEIARTEASGDFRDTVYDAGSRTAVEKKVNRVKRIAHVAISVTSPKHAGKPILALQRSFIVDAQ